MSGTFDAGQLVLELQGSGEPIASWPTAALLSLLRKHLLEPPWLADDPAGRLSLLCEVKVALERTGLDASAVVRLGLLDRFVRAFIAGVAVGSLPKSVDRPRSAARLGVPLDGKEAFLRQWAACGDGKTPFLKAAGDRGKRVVVEVDDDDSVFFAERSSEVAGAKIVDDDARTANLMGRIVDETMRELLTPEAIEHLFEWIGAAPLDDVFAWRNVEVRPSAFWSTASPELVNVYRWLIDRLTVTYPARWSTESLHLEWLWQRGEMPAPFDVDVLAERSLDPVELNAEIAHRAVRGRDRELTLDQAKDQVLSFLQAGDRRSAVDLFKAVCRRWPTSYEAHNNLGFCLLPDDPTQAVMYLHRAVELGFAAPATSAVNLMQAYLMLGENRLALNAAEEVWNDWEGSAPVVRVWLWDFRVDPRPVLVSDPRLPTLWLAMEAASRLGLPTAFEWETRHRELCSGDYLVCRCSDLVPLRRSR